MFSLKLATLSLPGPHREAEEAGTASGGDVGRAAGQAKMDPRGAGSPEGGGEAAAAAGGPGEEAPGDTCSWTAQETPEAPVSHRTRSVAGSLQLGVSARVAFPGCDK